MSNIANVNDILLSLSRSCIVHQPLIMTVQLKPQAYGIQCTKQQLTRDAIDECLAMLHSLRLMKA